MELNKKYLEFLLENVISPKIKTQLPKPQSDGRSMWVKLGPVVYMDVELEVLQKYTRSVLFKLKFDKYELEQLIFFPIESSPISIKEKLINKIEKLVYKTFIDDGRRDDIIKMYEDKMSNMFTNNSKISGKIIEKNAQRFQMLRYADIKHCPYLGLLNFEGDLFRSYDLLDGRFTIVDEHHTPVVTTNAAGILEYMEGAGKPIVNYNGKVWHIPQEHQNARPTREQLYKFLKLEISTQIK